jgi:hypothetical protein
MLWLQRKMATAESPDDTRMSSTALTSRSSQVSYPEIPVSSITLLIAPHCSSDALSIEQAVDLLQLCLLQKGLLLPTMILLRHLPILLHLQEIVRTTLQLPTSYRGHCSSMPTAKRHMSHLPRQLRLLSLCLSQDEVPLQP